MATGIVWRKQPDRQGSLGDQISRRLQKCWLMPSFQILGLKEDGELYQKNLKERQSIGKCLSFAY